MPEGVTNQEPISFELPPISQTDVDLFRKAIRSQYGVGAPPTFATLFRKSEFEWVDRLQIEVQAVLHAEQEYQYLQDLHVGDRPLIVTSLKNLKARGGMTFMVLESTLSCDGQVKLLAHTTFVVREAVKETA